MKKSPMLLYLFIKGWTIYREFQYQLSSKEVWPFSVGIINSVAKFKLFSLQIFMIVKVDYFQNIKFNIFLVQRYISYNSFTEVANRQTGRQMLGKGKGKGKRGFV